MKTLKRLVLLLLAVSMLCAYLVPSASAADSKEDIQQAIVETVMAYYYKGPYAQYDNIRMTTQTTLLTNKIYGELRSTDGEPADWASDDHTLYMVCSGLVYDTIYSALGYRLTGSGRTCLTINLSNKLDTDVVPGVIFTTGGTAGPFDEAAARASLDLLEPGDIICYCNLSDGTGHTGIYVGDVKGDGSKGYFVSSGGKKMSMTTGVDVIEDSSRKGSFGGGTVLLDPIVSAAGGYGYASMTGWHSFTIIRPTLFAQQKNLSITPYGKARLTYRGIDVDRTTSAKIYDTVKPGDEIKVTITITNHGKADYSGVSISEPVPVGATVAASSVKGGTLSGNTITGKLNVPAGGSAALEYTAKVTAARGEDVSFPSTTVAGAITTRAKSIRVGGEDWSKANLSTFEDLAKSKNASKIKKLSHNSDLGFVNSFYREFFGLDLGLPEKLQDLRDSVLAWTADPVLGSDTSEFSGHMLQPIPDSKLTELGKHVKQMILPEHLAGWNVYLRESLTEIPVEPGAQGRVMSIVKENYQPGDIFLGYNHRSTSVRSVYQPDVYIYLGNDAVAGIEKGSKEISVEKFSNNLSKFMRENVYLVLRPRLAFDDVNEAKAAPKPISFPDVKESDWFYGYVQELAQDGIVGGMSDGTFQPAGTLTYGQALKLLICALDKDVGNASSGHWASNYLSAAQSKGWISGSVNLDGGISRLAFCQVAAKAKNLTAQPESNPFTDTSDPAVLALNKAGVIGGMGEGKFSPDTTLTRAQISKIIVELRKV